MADFYRFYLTKEPVGDGSFCGYFHDLPGATTYGKDDAELMKNAQECLAFHLNGMLEDETEIPEPTDALAIPCEDGAQTVLIEVDMDFWTNEFKKDYVHLPVPVPEFTYFRAGKYKLDAIGIMRDALLMAVAKYERENGIDSVAEENEKREGKTAPFKNVAEYAVIEAKKRCYDVLRQLDRIPLTELESAK